MKYLLVSNINRPFNAAILAIVFLLLATSPTFGSSPCSEFSNDWVKCDVDDDCTVDDNACYFVAAYSKQHLTLVREHNKCIRPLIDCAPPPEGEKLKTLAVCRDHKCAAIPPKLNTNQFRLGFIAPLSGQAQVYGDSTKNGFELALDEIGRSWIEVTYEDDQFSPAKTVSAFHKLTSVDKVDAIVCVASTSCNAVAPLAEQKRIPLFAWASDVKVSAGRAFVLRTYPSGTAEGKRVAEEAVRRGMENVALIVSANDYSNSWRKGFEETFPSKGLLAKEETPNDAKDFRSVIMRSVSRKASQFAICLDPGQTAAFAKQVRQVKPTAQIFGCESLHDSAEIAAAGGALDTAWFATIPVTDDFRAKYVKHYGNDSVISGAANYYDLAYLLREALSTTGKSDLMSHFLSTGERQGAVGKFKIARDGDDRHFDIALEIKEVKAAIRNR